MVVRDEEISSSPLSCSHGQLSSSLGDNRNNKQWNTIIITLQSLLSTGGAHAPGAACALYSTCYSGNRTSNLKQEAVTQIMSTVQVHRCVQLQFWEITDKIRSVNKQINSPMFFATGI